MKSIAISAFYVFASVIPTNALAEDFDLDAAAIACKGLAGINVNTLVILKEENSISYTHGNGWTDTFEVLSRELTEKTLTLLHGENSEQKLVVNGEGRSALWTLGNKDYISDVYTGCKSFIEADTKVIQNWLRQN